MRVDNFVEKEAALLPPKPPRSAFMCYTDAKKKEILSRHDLNETEDGLKFVADEWKQLSDRERAFWDEEARNDKVRFVREKSEYKGPWIAPKRRAKKHPLAPKRPMSAFLAYSRKRRSLVKEQHPELSNTDVSRLLGEMWRNASGDEREPYVHQEEREREIYKEEIKQWRETQARAENAATRKSHHTLTNTAAELETIPAAPHSFSAFSDGLSYESTRTQHTDRSAETGNEVFRHVAYGPVGRSQSEDDHEPQPPMFRSAYARHDVSMYRPGTSTSPTELLGQSFAKLSRLLY